MTQVLPSILPYTKLGTETTPGESEVTASTRKAPLLERLWPSSPSSVIPPGQIQLKAHHFCTWALLWPSLHFKVKRSGHYLEGKELEEGDFRVSAWTIGRAIHLVGTIRGRSIGEADVFGFSMLTLRSQWDSPMLLSINKSGIEMKGLG